MNVDLQLETRVFLANVIWDVEGKWRTMANGACYRRRKLMGMKYRSQIERYSHRLPHEEITRWAKRPRNTKLSL